MKNNNPPFYVGQRVVCIRQLRSEHRKEKEPTPKKGKRYTIRDCEYNGVKWGVRLAEIINPPIEYLEGTIELLYVAHAFAPIREVRDHKRIAVPEELLHVVERDTIEPVKIKTI